MIRPDERVAQVLKRDPRLLDVFVGAAPAFERLRNPVLRRTMTRLVTVEQAARIAGIDAGSLVERLNRALSDPRSELPAVRPIAAAPTTHSSHEETPMPTLAEPMPDSLRSLAPERIVDLDVREDLRSGREPFSRIMAARRELAPGEVLRLRAIFEPVPLYHVLAKQGLDHWTEQLADDDWRIWFFAPANGAAPQLEGEPVACGGCGAPGAPGAARKPASTVDEASTGGDVVVLDVRGLEPPEPMVRTLAALDELPPGATLVQINVRVPQFLLPQLEARGFVWDVRVQSEDLVRLFIRRRSER